MTRPQIESLAPVFQSVLAALEEHRHELNQADPLNGNHGDHMVEIFRTASRAALDRPNSDPAGMMIAAADILEHRPDNGSALVYARGLRQMGEQIRRHSLTFAELAATLEKALEPDEVAETRPKPTEEKTQYPNSGAALKALLAGLAGWNRIEDGKPASENPLDVSALFDFGLALLQARQRNQQRIDVLADAAASASPLKAVPHRHQSAMIAVRAFLQAFQRGEVPSGSDADR